LDTCRFDSCQGFQNIMTKDEIIEAMAESAHDCWWKIYKDLGYTSRRAEWGEEFMVPFDKLSELGKDFDRAIMRAILKAFDRNGLEVVKKRI
jgi:hypothetical protein